MKRERIRQVVLALGGLFFVALLYPLCSDLWHSNWLLKMNYNECEPMFLSFYVALGFFLLFAVRQPSAHRSLIAFAGSSSLLHALVMTIETVEAWSHGIRRDYTDVVVAALVGGVLLAIMPRARNGAANLSSAEVQRQI